jgi:hypothetical protein
MKARIPKCPSKQSRNSLRLTPLASMTSNNAAGCIIPATRVSACPFCPSVITFDAAGCGLLDSSIAIPCLIAFPPGITTDRSGTQQSELTLLAGRMPSAILSCWPTSFSAHSKISPNVTPLSEDRLSQYRMLESS